MSGRDERKLVDVRGRFRYVAREGDRVAEDDWRECRLVVTTRRLAVGTGDGTRSVGHDDAAVLDADALPDGVDPDVGTPVRFGDAVLLLDAGDDVDLERARHRAVVEGDVVLVRPRAVVDGTERGDADWRQARVRLSEGRVTVSVRDGDPFAFDADAVSSVANRTATVAGEERPVVAVTYAEKGATVETHFSGTERSTDALGGLFRSLAGADGGGVAGDSAAATNDGASNGEASSGGVVGDAAGATDDATASDAEAPTAAGEESATAAAGEESTTADGAADADAGSATEASEGTDAGDASDADGEGDADPDGGLTPADLSEADRRVLAALYSGVSPFEMADFVGMDVDEVEATYQRLLDAGVVDEIRTRTEVAINGTGRNVASESMSEE